MNPKELFSNFSMNDEYSMKGRHMGVAVIFNQVNFPEELELSPRKGSTKDKEDLVKVLTKFNFNVREFDDLTSLEIKRTLKKVAQEDHKENNCLLIVMMSHGDSEGIIYTNDDQILTESLWKPFIDVQACPTLEGKPKLFFIQACRGALTDFGAVVEKMIVKSIGSLSIASNELSQSMLKSSKREIVYTFDDVLIYFSTAEGFPAFKNAQGSWFIQSICDNFEKVLTDGNPTDLMNILLRVNREIAYSRQAVTDNGFNTCKQMPVICSMLTKSFIVGGRGNIQSGN
jgi:hypothetical protein